MITLLEKRELATLLFFGLWQTAYIVVNPIMAENFASLFNCTLVGSQTKRRLLPQSFISSVPDYQCLWPGLSSSCLWFSYALVSAPQWVLCFVSSQHFNYMCFFFISLRYYISKKGKRKVQGVPQSQTAALPRHQEEEDKYKQAQIEQTYEKH